MFLDRAPGLAFLGGYLIYQPARVVKNLKKRAG
jgi:hypothetical protein